MAFGFWSPVVLAMVKERVASMKTNLKKDAKVRKRVSMVEPTLRNRLMEQDFHVKSKLHCSEPNL